MHVVYLNPVGVLGGGERVLLTLVRSTLAKFPSSRVSVVLLGDGPLVAALQSLGASVHVLPLPTTFAGLGDSFPGAGSSSPLPGPRGGPLSPLRKQSCFCGGSGGCCTRSSRV